MPSDESRKISKKESDGLTRFNINNRKTYPHVSPAQPNVNTHSPAVSQPLPNVQSITLNTVYHSPSSVLKSRPYNTNLTSHSAKEASSTIQDLNNIYNSVAKDNTTTLTPNLI